MISVMLVDDEEHVLSGMTKIINWEGEGFTIIGKASGYKQALELFEKEKPEEPKANSYFQAKQAFKSKAFATAAPVKQFGNPSAGGIDYGVGDRVRHMKFGEGTVTNIVQGGRDFEVTVDFDAVGTKKMFAMFAKLKKV